MTTASFLLFNSIVRLKECYTFIQPTNNSLEMPENFFNEQAASTIQIFSLLFELTGLTLLVFELKFPKNRSSLEQKIELLINSIDLWKIWKRATTPYYHRGQIVIILVLITITISISIQPLLILAPMTFYLIGSTLHFFNSMANKKPLSTIGLFIASIGILGEFYQVILIIQAKSY